MNNGYGAWYGQDPRLRLLACWGRLEGHVPEGFDQLPWLADRTRVPYRKLHFAKRVRNSVAHGSPVDRGQVAEAIRILDLAARSLGRQPGAAGHPPPTAALAEPFDFVLRRAGVLGATILMLFGSLLAAASALEFVVRATRGTLSWSALCWNLVVCALMVRGGQWVHRRFSRPAPA